tara:strand:+ start:362 stop:601 length:240 start_codon:yes stop_codon:yes gene_type:complete
MTIIEATDDSRNDAIKFLQSFRGRYIIGQALFYAIKELKSVEPDVHQEKSNISDMEYLKEELFDFPDSMYTSQSVKESH